MRCILSSSSLIALIWASAALATPLIAEPLHSRDLEVRQSDSKCPGGYTSKNGLNFTTYCETNNPWNDALDPFEVGSMEECMERCSRFWGNGEGCFGVVWREDNFCWMRNSTTSTANMVSDTGIHSALVESSDMEPLDEDCPFNDLSTHELDNGLGYTVHCGKVIGGFDTCWQGYPSCLQNPFIGFYHATSLQDCLQYCVKEHPLCRAVSYNPGLEIGFANCWPKSGFGNTLDTPPSSQGTMHSATITSIDRVDSTCPSDNKYTATGNKNFEIHCGQSNGGTNITAIHRQNMTACMDACARRNKGCVGVVFDSSLQFGFQNCYLQNTTSVISDIAQATYALLSGSSIPSSSASSAPGDGGNNNNDDDDGGSKAWIAGPVIGGVVGIALIAGALFWWRRRKSEPGKQADYAPAPSYNSYQGQNEMVAAPPSELGGDHAREMPATEYKPATKYAHGGGSAAPQELPT